MTRTLDQQQLVAQFPDVIEGDLGCLEGEFHLDVDPQAKKVQLPLRKITIAKKEPLKAELDRLEDLEAIQKVSYPTDRVSH